MTITLTAVPSMAPVPHVRADVSGMPVGAVAFTLRRSAGSRRVDVRGAIEVAATSTLVVRDWQAPIDGSELVYDGVWLDSAGAVVGTEAPVSVRLHFPGTVLQQPLDPTRSLLVEDLDATARVTEREHRGQLVSIAGAGDVFLGSGPSGVSASLRFRITSLEDREKLERALDLYPVLCLRTSRELHLPQPFIFLVQRTPLDSYDRFYGGQRSVAEWSVVETREPVPALVMTAYTYEDLEASFSTYEDLEAAFGTYEELEDATYLQGAA